MTDSARVKIRKGVADLIRRQFGPRGKQEAIFRKVISGAWRPGQKNRPRCTVVEEGQQAESGSADLCERDITLRITIVVDLKENWDREEEYDRWCNRIQQIIELVQGRVKTGAGQIRMNYVDDDPLQVVIRSGANESIWRIDFDAEYLMKAPLDTY